MNKKILLLFSVLCVLQCNGYCLTKEEKLELLQEEHAGHDFTHQYDWSDTPEPVAEAITVNNFFHLANTSCNDSATLNVTETHEATACWSISGTLEAAAKAALKAALIAKAEIGTRVSGTGTTGETVGYTLTVNVSTNVSPKTIKHCKTSLVTTTATGTYKKSDLHFICDTCPCTVDYNYREATGSASGMEIFITLTDEAIDSDSCGSSIIQ